MARDLERYASLVITLGSNRARLVMLALGILFAVWQGYIFVWVPLSAEHQLPAGLAPVQPKVDVDTLVKIQTARAQRLQHVPEGFRGADQYFASPSPTPP